MVKLILSQLWGIIVTYCNIDPKVCVGKTQQFGKWLESLFRSNSD